MIENDVYVNDNKSICIEDQMNSNAKSNDKDKRNKVLMTEGQEQTMLNVNVTNNIIGNDAISSSVRPNLLCVS